MTEGAAPEIENISRATAPTNRNHHRKKPMRIKDIEIEGTARWTGDTTTWDKTKVTASFRADGDEGTDVQLEFYANREFPAVRIPVNELRKLVALVDAVEAISNQEN